MDLREGSIPDWNVFLVIIVNVQQEINMKYPRLSACVCVAVHGQEAFMLRVFLLMVLSILCSTLDLWATFIGLCAGRGMQGENCCD